MRVKGFTTSSVIVVLLLSLHTVLLGWISFTKAPNIDEIGHLSAGLSHWELRDFKLYRVNPPLVRMIAALPVYFSDAKRDWYHLYDKEWKGRREWQVGEDFTLANPEEISRLFVLSRWACIPFSLIGGLFCFRWARKLYGLHSGYVALSLWCVSPTILGNASMITPDIGAASFGMAAAFFFWQWLQHPSWKRATISGAALGIAQLTKTTLLIFYPLLPCIFLFWRLCDSPDDGSVNRSHMVRQMLLIIVGSLLVLNAGYCFTGSGQRLGDYHLKSYLLRGTYDASNQQTQEKNCLANTIFAGLPVPFPSDYVLGIDMQKLNFEQGMWSYLRGKWKFGGWWHYYFYALVIKVPLGTWCLTILALLLTIFGQGYNVSLRDEMILLVLGLAILIFVSSQTGFSVHSRYIIPAMPFLFIWISKVARVFKMRPFIRMRLVIATIVIATLTWSTCSSLTIYPHSLSYFNELVGGPRRGGEHLLGSNIDWGQDLFYLEKWLNKHPEVTLDGLAYYGSYSVTLTDIPQTPHPLPGLHLVEISHDFNASEESVGPIPGWYALSVNHLYDHSGKYRYFLDHFKPVASAGYSIYIYHLKLDKVNQVRVAMGLTKYLSPKKINKSL